MKLSIEFYVSLLDRVGEISIYSPENIFKLIVAVDYEINIVKGSDGVYTVTRVGSKA